MPLWHRRQKREPDEMYVGLRSQLLGLDPRTIGLSPPPKGPQVWACLMDMGFPEGVATLAVVTDGTTSMYTSTGGGVIGGGERESVARESRAFLDVVEQNLGHLAVGPDPDLPADGFVHIHALTHEGRLVATAPESQLADGAHGLSPVYVAGHRVLRPPCARPRRAERSPERMPYEMATGPLVPVTFQSPPEPSTT